MKVLWRALRGLAMGVWDFLVGDTPEFLPAVVVVVLLAYGLHAVRALAVVVIPAAVVLMLVASLAVWRVRSYRRR